MAFLAAVRLAVVLGALVAGSARAEPIAEARGRWSGAGGPPAGGPVELRVDGTAERFSVTFTGPQGPLMAGEFRPGPRKDVYGAPTSKGLMDWLGGSDANPLDKPLAWARREDGALVVYRLELRGGAHRLDRLAIKPSAARVDVAFERREHGRAPQAFTATLERRAGQ